MKSAIETSVYPIISLPKNSLREDKENENKDGKKGKPIAINVARPDQIERNVVQNLSHLKLSKLNRIAIQYTAKAVAGQHSGKRRQSFYRLPAVDLKVDGMFSGFIHEKPMTKQDRWKPIDVAKSANMPARYWPESRIARRTAETSLLGRKGKAIRALDVIAQINNGYPEKKG
jgi:hypothetical protein